MELPAYLKLKDDIKSIKENFALYVHWWKLLDCAKCDSILEELRHAICKIDTADVVKEMDVFHSNSEIDTFNRHARKVIRFIEAASEEAANMCTEIHEDTPINRILRFKELIEKVPEWEQLFQLYNFQMEGLVHQINIAVESIAGTGFDKSDPLNSGPANTNTLILHPKMILLQLWNKDGRPTDEDRLDGKKAAYINRIRKIKGTQSDYRSDFREFKFFVVGVGLKEGERATFERYLYDLQSPKYQGLLKQHKLL
jgi:hypothetical protein